MVRQFHFHFKNIPINTLSELKENIIKKSVVIPNGTHLGVKPLEGELLEKNLKLFQEIKKTYSIKKYFFYVGGFNARKNLLVFIKSFKLYTEKNEHSPHLVLAGMENHYFKKKILPLIRTEKKIISLGYLREELLFLLYRNSELFFYPSTREGFGMPPLEALALNKVAIVDNDLPLNDWNLRGLIPINMNKTEEIIKVMKNTPKSLPNKHQLKPFSWTNIARTYQAKVIKSML